MDVALHHRFAYHPPDEAKAQQHAAIRGGCANLADFLDEQLKDGREKSVALTKLEECMYWANASIARDVGVV